MRILFWNTNKNDNINEVLSELIIEQKASMVFLAEYEAEFNNLLVMLREQGVVMDRYPTPGCKRIVIIGDRNDIAPGSQTKYASLQICDRRIILCCVHLNSRIYSDHESKRAIEINRIVNDIESAEVKLNTESTIVFGDFNSNPYETNCLGAQGFHGIPVSKEAERKVRTISDESFKMFYNPMWNMFGDFSFPPGTYYYNGSDTVNPYWSIFDQVIIRPSLRKQFIDQSLKIVTSTKTFDLIDAKGHPNKIISDHLPIVFEIKEDVV